MQELISALATKKICVQNMKIIISLKLTTKELNISAFNAWGPFVCGRMLRRLHLSAAGNRTYMLFSLFGKNIESIFLCTKERANGKMSSRTKERARELANEDRTSDRTNERTNKRTNARANERTSKRTNEQTTRKRPNEGRTSERTKERRSVRTNKRTSERTKERTTPSERTNDRTSKRTNKRRSQPSFPFPQKLRCWMVIKIHNS